MFSASSSTARCRASNAAQAMCGVTMQIRNAGLEQRAAVDRRFLRQHIDGRAAEIAALERRDQRVEIDQRAARGVDRAARRAS